MRRGTIRLSAAACIVGGLASSFAVPRSGAAMRPVPEDGAVVDGAYRNEYFGLTYPLMRGWRAGASSPPPSQTGDYVLANLVPDGSITATILITAQDLLFAERPLDPLAAVGDLRRTVSGTAGMTIDREPSDVRIAGRAFHRVDYSGVGLHRALLVTEDRCHLVRFNLTAREPEMLAELVVSLNDLSFAAAPDKAKPDPVCVKDYAVADRELRKVAPLPVGPAFTPIPARFVVSADGGVEHVHVIRATSDQRASIENALYQWRFKPYANNGRAVEVETGLLFRFSPR
jgi:hypothetical protein